MTAQKAINKHSGKMKFVLDARPPQRLSKEEKELLSNLKPSQAMLDRVAKMIKFPVVDGASCGL